MAIDGLSQSWLEAFIRDHGGVAGTVHIRSADTLMLAAAVHIPEKVLAVVASIPKGKGMAGLAWERNEAVSTCNIQSDASTDVKPGAKAVDAQTGVALPVRDAAGGVRAVVGIAYREEKTLLQSELDELSAAASTLPSST